MVDYDNQGLWEGAQKHKLMIQRCKDCGTFVHPPRPCCPNCNSFSREWVQSSGKGKIYSWVTVNYDKVGYPGMMCPYSIVLVDIEEGVRLVTNVVDMKPEDIYIGMPVEVVFEDIGPDLTLFKFKKSKGAKAKKEKK
jgi:hypothetical protein